MITILLDDVSPANVIQGLLQTILSIDQPTRKIILIAFAQSPFVQMKLRRYFRIHLKRWP